MQVVHGQPWAVAVLVDPSRLVMALATLAELAILAIRAIVKLLKLEA